MGQVPEKQKTEELEKQEEGPKRFVERGLVLYDTETNIYWMKKDSWQDKSKFFNWHEARDYADTKNMRKIGGFADWRLPTAEEAQTIFDKGKENLGKGGSVLHLASEFPEGGFKSCWLAGDTSTRRPRFDYTEGKVLSVDEYAFGSVRLCRRGQMAKAQGHQQARR